MGARESRDYADRRRAVDSAVPRRLPSECADGATKPGETDSRESQQKQLGGAAAVERGPASECSMATSSCIVRGALFFAIARFVQSTAYVGIKA